MEQQFINRKNFRVSNSEEGSSFERDDPVTPLPSLNSTAFPSSESYEQEVVLLQSNSLGLMKPRQRSEREQQRIQSRVSGEGEPFCPDDTFIFTEPTAAVRSSIFHPVDRTTEDQFSKLERTSYLLDDGPRVIQQLWAAAIHHRRVYRAYPEQLHLPNHLKERIKKELRGGEFHEDFDGVSIPFTEELRLFISFSEGRVRNNSVECLSQRYQVNKKDVVDDNEQFL